MGGFRGGRRLLRVRGRIRQETRVGEGKDDAIKFRNCGKKWKFDDHWSLAGGFTFPFKSLQRQRLRDLEGPPKPIFTRLSASPQLSRRRIKKPRHLPPRTLGSMLFLCPAHLLFPQKFCFLNQKAVANSKASSERHTPHVCTCTTPTATPPGNVHAGGEAQRGGRRPRGGPSSGVLGECGQRGKRGGSACRLIENRPGEARAIPVRS